MPSTPVLHGVLGVLHGPDTPKLKPATPASRSRRLPELDAVAFEIPDPRKFAVRGVVALGIDAHACCGQLGEQSVEVVDAEVDHGLLRALPEIGRIEGEMGEDGRACGFRAVEGERSAALVLNAEVRRVPLRERPGVARLEKDAAYADCFCHKNRFRAQGSGVKSQLSAFNNPAWRASII